MADLDSRKRTKCSGSRNRLQLRSWIWFTILKSLISIPCVYSKCLGVDITVALYPEGDISLAYGEPLEIFCISENYSSHDLAFTLGGKTVESEIYNATTRRLYIKRPERQISSYYCVNNKTRKTCTSRVLVDSPPADVTDFNCLSQNLEILTCTWTPHKGIASVNYNVTFSVNGNLVTLPCIAPPIASPNRSCTWNTSSQPRYRQQDEEQKFHMTGCNIFGCNSQNFTIDHYSIVKPDPPIDLKVVKNGSHSVVLKWSVPNNIFDLLGCGVDHIIEYQIAKIDSTLQFHRVNTSMLPPKNKTYKFTLSNLPYAHMMYDVRVYIKSKKAVKEKYWSDYAYNVFFTASERPRRPPDTIRGAFHQATYSHSRVIYVYWKQLEEYEEAGANFTYKVLVSQGNKTEIVHPEKNKSLSYVILNNATLNELHVTVWSENTNGSSPGSSHLYIPPEKDTHPLKPTSFTKLAYENGTYELSWRGIENIDNYTLFWCQHNTTQICAGRLDFTVLEPKKVTHVIDLPREYRYQFAISANNGTKTSGMVWARCDISKDGFVMYGFPVHLNYDAPGKSYVTLRWEMDCALQDGVITGYNITYCPIIQTSTHCDKSIEQKHIFIPNPKKMFAKIENLLPFKTYQFTLALNTIYGQKTIENATARITTSEDTPTNPINVYIPEVRNNSLVISWDPPLQRNGNIGKYVILNYGKELYVEKVFETDTSRRQVTIPNLQSFTNYSLNVQACNNAIGLCSNIKQNDAILVRTRIGSPSRLKAPTVKNDPDMLKWEPPEIPGGTVDLYQIKRIKDDSEPEILHTTELSYILTHCEGVVSTETYQVRAVNFDNDSNHGVIAVGNVTVPIRNESDTHSEYPGPWSEPSTVACKSRDGITMILIFMAIFILIGAVYGSIKLYKKYRKMEDIKPVLPSGLGIPEKDISKYTFGGWNPTNKEEKPSSDEMLLLPNSKTTVSSQDVKQKDENCGASDQTDSTALSESSRGPVDRQVSTSDDASNSSFHIEAEPIKGNDDANEAQEENSSLEDTESSRENSPYFSDKSFKENPATGYVQPVVNAATGYVQSAPAPIMNPHTNNSTQPASTSYVMAGLPPPVFTTSTAPQVKNPPAPSSGYVCNVLPEDAQARSMLNFSKLGSPPSKSIGPESLPTMPTLPPQSKHAADSSYIQLQSLDSLPSFKPSVRNSVPLKPSASNGYVSPEDVVINKHLNNILSAGQLAEEPAILDPTMSPDAYCRFSWSTDPANDNLHTLLADSPTRTSKN